MIHNSANSGVGRALIAIAKSLGLKTVNVVRRDDVVADIKAIGGDIVLVDGPDLAKRVAAETGKAPIALAVDGVADVSSAGLLACLTDKGVHVFYSAITGKPLVAPAQPLIFRDVSIRGFWLANWFKTATPDKITEMYDRLTPLVASGAISSPVAGTYKFGQIAEAVAVASKNRGKALFVPGLRRAEPAERSGRAHRIEEFADLELQPVAVGRQRLRRRMNLRGGRSGLGRAVLHVGDVGGDLLRCPARPAGCCGIFPASRRPALPPRRQWSRISPTCGRWCRRSP